jgi:hypothetical protein
VTPSLVGSREEPTLPIGCASLADSLLSQGRPNWLQFTVRIKGKRLPPVHCLSVSLDTTPRINKIDLSICSPAVGGAVGSQRNLSLLDPTAAVATHFCSALGSRQLATERIRNNAAGLPALVGDHPVQQQRRTARSLLGLPCAAVDR